MDKRLAKRFPAKFWTPEEFDAPEDADDAVGILTPYGDLLPSNGGEKSTLESPEHIVLESTPHKTESPFKEVGLFPSADVIDEAVTVTKLEAGDSAMPIGDIVEAKEKIAKNKPPGVGDAAWEEYLKKETINKLMETHGLDYAQAEAFQKLGITPGSHLADPLVLKAIEDGHVAPIGGGKGLALTMAGHDALAVGTIEELAAKMAEKYGIALELAKEYVKEGLQPGVAAMPAHKVKDETPPEPKVDITKVGAPEKPELVHPWYPVAGLDKGKLLPGKTVHDEIALDLKKDYSDEPITETLKEWAAVIAASGKIPKSILDAYALQEKLSKAQNKVVLEHFKKVYPHLAENQIPKILDLVTEISKQDEENKKTSCFECAYFSGVISDPLSGANVVAGCKNKMVTVEAFKHKIKSDHSGAPILCSAWKKKEAPEDND